MTPWTTTVTPENGTPTVLNQAAPGQNPQMMQAIIAAMKGGANPAEPKPVAGSPPSMGQSIGSFAQAAAAAHKKANPGMFSPSGAFDWSRVLAADAAPAPMVPPPVGG